MDRILDIGVYFIFQKKNLVSHKIELLFKIMDMEGHSNSKI